MHVRMYPTALKGAIWICSPDVVGQLLTMALAAPVTTSGPPAIAPPLWLGERRAAGNRPAEIPGLPPLFVSEKCPALGSLGDLALINPAFYLVGDRMEMTLKQSEHYKFASDLLAVRLLDRVTGRFWLQSPITPANGGSTLSPLVLLQ
jgi:HK97 family phage major capsid protein